MNNKGQTLFMSLMVAMMIFAVGVIAINFLTPEIDVARSSAALDCSNAAISDGTKVSCLIVDIVIPYFIVATLSLAGGYITSRLLI
jgi:hypothetical protein